MTAMVEGFPMSLMERLIEKGHKPFTMPLDQMALRGLLPTPTCFDATNASNTMKSTQVKEGSMHSVTLTRALSMGMLPTPNSRDYKDAQTPEKYQARKELWAEKGVNLQLTLPQLIKNQMLPTPQSRDWKGAQGRAYKGEAYDLPSKVMMEMLPTPMASDCGDKVTGLETQDSLTKRAREITGKTSQLSPQFVMEMMGFPTDWTELPFLNGETNQLKQEEMQ
jgi:hypothetical protein